RGLRGQRLCLVVDLRVDGRAESRDRDESGEIRELACGDERQQDRRHRRERGGCQATAEEQQVPPEEKCLLQVVRHAGLARRTFARQRLWDRRHDQSPARVEVARVSMMSRISLTRSTKPGSRSMSFGGRSGGGTVIWRMIVPGADEKT